MDAVVMVAVAVVAVRPVVARTVAAGSLRLAIALVSRQVSLVGEALSVIDWHNLHCAALPGLPTQAPDSSEWQGRRVHHLGQTTGRRPASGPVCAVGPAKRKEGPFGQETTCLGSRS